MTDSPWMFTCKNKFDGLGWSRLRSDRQVRTRWMQLTTRKGHLDENPRLNNRGSELIPGRGCGCFMNPCSPTLPAI